MTPAMTESTDRLMADFTTAHPVRPRDCPLCGSLLLAPEATEFRGGGRVHHVWSCDDCGYAFCTAVVISNGRMTASVI